MWEQGAAPGAAPAVHAADNPWQQKQQQVRGQGATPGAAPEVHAADAAETAVHAADAAETARRRGGAGDPAQAKHATR